MKFNSLPITILILILIFFSMCKTNKKEEILKMINSENIFYQISSRRYFLKELLIIELFKNFEEIYL